MTLTKEERLEEYFWQISLQIPEPFSGWEKAVKPCKWDKILKERLKPSSV